MKTFLLGLSARLLTALALEKRGKSQTLRRRIIKALE